MERDLVEESAHAADARDFRRNVLLVVAAHFVVVAVLFWVANWTPKPPAQQLVWMNAGTLGGGAADAAEPAGAEPEPEPAPTPDPVPKPIPEPSVPDPPAPEPPAPSEIVVPKATPAPTPKPATPKPATPKPATPKPSTPKPTPKSTPKSTPKPSPKASVKPKATASASPKAKASPTVKSSPKPAVEGAEKSSAKTASTDAKKGAGGSNSGDAKGAGKGTGKSGTGTGSTGTSDFGWYFEMLHDRLHNRWNQPTSIVRSSLEFVTTLKLSISKDGTILSREIAHSSGNTVLDDSVLAAAAQVLSVDPLPAGLGGDTLEININFKLDQN